MAIPSIIYSQSQPGMAECACHRERRPTVAWNITRRADVGYEGVGGVALCEEGLAQTLAKLRAREPFTEELRAAAEALGVRVPPKAPRPEVERMLAEARSAEARAAEEARQREVAAKPKPAALKVVQPALEDTADAAEPAPDAEQARQREALASVGGWTRKRLRGLSRADLIEVAKQEPWGLLEFASSATKDDLIGRMAEITPALPEE